MYEIVLQVADVELVVETVVGVVAASNMVSWYRMQGHQCHYRPRLRMAA